ncbi:MAG TPA: hypothetical protein DEQ02_07975 [Ruminococcaceae bacterium]|nr:hypothetical protein [Oscillospiraceae bacterium]
MHSKALSAAKLNFRNMKLATIITGITVLAMLVQELVYIILAENGNYAGWESNPVGIGNYFYLLVILAAIFIPLQNFRKMVNLGAKRKDFFLGCAVNYVILAAGASLVSIVLYYTFEQFMLNYHAEGVLNVLPVFGWAANGPIVAFFQQFAFLLLFSSFIHTLAAAQDKWYGWVADAVIVVILSVFIPIEPLRMALVWFFNMIIFQSAPLQILCCLVLAIVIYSLNKPILARKVI